MKAEILCIGTELLLGDTVNTNAAYISGQLASLGIDCFFHSVTGDNSSRIKSSMDVALERSDILIVTGGLGPTDDDITMQAIAEYFHKATVFDEFSFQKINEFFQARGLEMPEKAKQQAFFPEGAEIIPNPCGTAPGIIWEINEKIIIILPGVPDELYKMWEKTVKNYLKKYSEYVIKTRFLKFFGIPEGTLGDMLKDLMQSRNPTVAPLISEGQPNIRITAKAKSESDAQSLIKEKEQVILQRAGEYLWGYDDDTLQKIAGNLLLEKNLTVSIAESCTGGLVSSMLTDIPGSSAYIKLNLVTYSNTAKIQMLNVSPGIIKKHGAVSEETARAMAQGIRKISGTDIGIGITGIAGPSGGSSEKPVGLVYIGIASNNKSDVYKININPDFSRTKIKQRTGLYALNFLRRFIL